MARFFSFLTSSPEVLDEDNSTPAPTFTAVSAPTPRHLTFFQAEKHLLRIGLCSFFASCSVLIFLLLSAVGSADLLFVYASGTDVTESKSTEFSQIPCVNRELDSRDQHLDLVSFAKATYIASDEWSWACDGKRLRTGRSQSDPVDCKLCIFDKTIEEAARVKLVVGPVKCKKANKQDGVGPYCDIEHYCQPGPQTPLQHHAQPGKEHEQACRKCCQLDMETRQAVSNAHNTGADSSSFLEIADISVPTSSRGLTGAMFPEVKMVAAVGMTFFSILAVSIYYLSPGAGGVSSKKSNIPSSKPTNKINNEIKTNNENQLNEEKQLVISSSPNQPTTATETTSLLPAQELVSVVDEKKE